MPECDVVLGRTALLATGGPAAELLTAGGERRPGGRGDLAEACRLADGLPEVAVVAGPPLALARGGAAADVPSVARGPGRAVAEELEVCFANTTKHVVLTTVESPAQAEAVAAMAAAVAGDDEALRRRPPVSLVAPGLRPAEPALDALLAAARRGLPVGFALALGDASGAAGSAPATTSWRGARRGRRPRRAPRPAGRERPRRLHRRAARRARRDLHREPYGGRPVAAPGRPRRRPLGLAFRAGVQ